jgi:tetratricopeptide (TPR) repeat protein
MFAYGETMNRLAQPDRALELLEQAFAKDSFHPPSWEFAKGHARVLLGEFDAAIAHFTAVLSRVERFIPARVQLARALQEHGQHSAAQEMVRLLKSYAPKYSLAAAERMFPYPDAQQKSRLITALSEAGLE